MTKLRPAAVSLLDHPREKIADDKPMPLLAMHYYGKGLVLFSAVEETWRWRFNEADKYFARYWGQVVYAIGLPHTLGSKSGPARPRRRRSGARQAGPGLRPAVHPGVSTADHASA